jgi:hypothetical protein
MIRLRNWEYWPFGIVQFPLFFYYPWLSFRARSFTFFAASNPGILMGGMFGESKFQVLELIPAEYKPRSLIFKKEFPRDKTHQIILENHLDYPLIFKPDIGERGFMVRRINSPQEAEAYAEEMRHDFIIQELVSLPLEFGVFYARFPQDESGTVTSIVMKEMLSIEGDGKSTLKELILNKERAKLQWPSLEKKYRNELDVVLPKGEKREIVSIGNHCLGTKFINANHLINNRLIASFDQISKSIPGFYFGRFDLRCASIEDLERGNIRIVELNGCGAEPAHIYDPRFSFFKAVAILIEHWRTIFDIAQQNKNLGIDYIPLKEAIRHYHNFKEKTQ